MKTAEPRPRGNSSRRGHRKAETADKEAYWQKQKTRGPFAGGGIYNFADSAIDGLDIRLEYLTIALHYLHRITGDETFLTSIAALDGYGLKNGGLQSQTKQLLKSTGSTLENFAAIRMRSKTQIEAERVVSYYGIPGTSFATAVREVIRARKALEQRWAAGEPNPKLPDGNTGRHLLVRFATLWLGVDDQPISSLFGIELDDDGFAIVPDTRSWRSEVAAGRIVSFGILTDDDQHGVQRREAWKKLQEFSNRKSSL